jgi:outer membrane protein
VARAEQRNYSVLNFQAALQIADYEVDRNRAGHLPTVDLVAGYNDASASGSISTLGGPSIPNDLKAKTVGVQLTLPLYAGGSINSKVRQAIASRDKARQDLEFNRRGAAQSARTAFLSVVNGVAQVLALEQAVVSAETALASAQLGLQVGVRTNLDVLNSQQQVYSARRDLYQARYNYLINVLKLRAAVGELTEAQVEEINRMLVNG